MTRALLGVAVVSVVVSCGDNGSPSQPSPPAIAQVGGVWTGSTTLTNISGGECLGPLLASSVGAVDRFTAVITQTGSHLSATETSHTTGTSCSSTGTAGTNTVTLNITSCQVDTITGLRCANGAFRDMSLVAGGATGTVSGGRINGTSAQSWNIYVAGTSVGVGILTANATFTMSR